MSGFAFRIVDGKATRVDVKEALTCTADLVWVHLSTTAEHAQAWLRDEAKLLDYVVDALTATETRPRCEAVGDGAFLNLRGRSKEELDTSDLLASVRIWAVKGRVYSVTRKPLIAVAEVEKMVERHEVRDPGDLIAAFATAITTDLDPDVATLGDELDDCEEQLDANRVFELRRAVSKVRVAAIGYKRFLSPQRAALEKARMAEELESIRERSALVHETLTDLRAEQIDNRSLIISIAAMVFLPLTFLTGLYGMNVKGLPYAEEPWAFDAIAGACVLIAVGVVAYFAMRHWFKR
jgi:zinc transporter